MTTALPATFLVYLLASDTNVIEAGFGAMLGVVASLLILGQSILGGA